MQVAGPPTSTEARDAHRPSPKTCDVCWEETGVDPVIFDPVLLIFDPGRATQKSQVHERALPCHRLPLTQMACHFWSSSRQTESRESQRHCGHGLGSPRMIKNERQSSDHEESGGALLADPCQPQTAACGGQAYIPSSPKRRRTHSRASWRTSRSSCRNTKP